MKVLYSTMSVVEYDGKHYYNNPVQATYKRYLPLGDEIRVFSYSRRVDKPKSDLIDDGVLSFTFAYKVNSVSSLLKGLSKKNDKTAEQLVKWADVCVVHVPCEHSYQVVKYARKYNKPYMTVVCGCPWDAFWNYDWRGKIVAPIEYLELRKIQNNATNSIYVTNIFLQHRYPTKGKSIGCSNVNISTGLPGVLEKRLNNIEQRQKEGRVLKIGTAAAVDVQYKGQEYVIRALSKLKACGIYYEYHLIGSGSEERLCKIAEDQGVAKQVFFHGQLPHSAVMSFMDDIDIYIQPSKQEGLPRATIEAMSRGCLCLGSKVAGIPELLEPEFLFAKGAVNEIVNILKKVTKASLIEQASLNYNKAKEYDCSILNERRRRFIEDFKNSIL